MAGVKYGTIMFIIAGLFMIVQAVISVAAFDDGIGALVAGTFAFLMFIGAIFAKTGMMSAVTELSYEEDWGHTKVRHYRDTGQRIQCTPCFGFCGGIGAIVVAIMFAADIDIIYVAPGIIGGIIAILAALLFIAEYKGKYTFQVAPS